VDVDGSFADYVKIPEQNAWPIPSQVPIETASVLEPLGNAVHAASAADIPGSDTVIFGCGPVGLSAVAITYVLGALSVTAIDINDYRLRLAKRMGASKVINSRTVDPVAEIHKDTEGRGAGVVLEMSGNEVAIRNAFRTVRNGGTVILFGLPSGEVRLNLADEVIFKEAHVRGVVGREIFKSWYILNDLLKSRKLDLRPLITHRMPLNQIDDAMKLVGSGECGKIILSP
jgi:threonine 3-dehydrogenase